MVRTIQYLYCVNNTYVNKTSRELGKLVKNKKIIYENLFKIPTLHYYAIVAHKPNGNIHPELFLAR